MNSSIRKEEIQFKKDQLKILRNTKEVAKVKKISGAEDVKKIAREAATKEEFIAKLREYQVNLIKGA